MSHLKRLLVIDDEEAICFAFRRFFEARGWVVQDASSAAEGLQYCRRDKPTVVFLDIRLPDGSGLELLADLEHGADIAVVVMTAYSSLETTVRAVQARAFDYLVKPIDLDQALQLADRAVERRVPPRGPRAVDSSETQGALVTLVGASPAMQRVHKLIARAAHAETPVLLTGATGTGKELVARAIHEYSPRRGDPFVAVNCGALPEALVESELFGAARGAFTGADADRPGRFELAHGGTLLLDEVSELSLAAQVKLLRVLDSCDVERIGGTKSRRVDVRIIAATNRDLQAEMLAGRFRADLYYRLAVLSVHLPLLRERREDIVPLAEHFLARSAPTGFAGLSAPVARRLVEYGWPGNVRELKNAIESAAAIAPDRMIALEDLPDAVRNVLGAAAPAEDSLGSSVLAYLERMEHMDVARYSHLLERVERTAIAYALRRCHERQSEAAHYLGIHRNTLRNRIRELQRSNASAARPDVP